MHPNSLILLCILLWGAWGLFSKLSNVHNAPIFVTVACHLVYALFSLPLLFKLKTAETPINWSFSALIWIVLTAVAGVGAKVAFNYALSKEAASIVVPTTSVFPVVTVFLAVLFLNEKVNLTQSLGMVLCIAGVWLVALGK